MGINSLVHQHTQNMKIQKINIQGIQSYKKRTSIFLHPGLNVIYGDTDSGKSTIIRALKFCVFNSSGKDFISHNFKGESFVSLEDFEGNFVKRAKGSGKNTYELYFQDNSMLYEALRNDIPFKVREFLNISQFSLQQQKDMFFLIDKSDGYISKELNKVSGLSIVTESLSIVNKRINSINQNVRTINNNILLKESKIKELSWINTIEKELIELEKCNTEYDELKKNVDQVLYWLSEHDKLQKLLKFSLPDSLLVKFHKVNSLIQIYTKHKHTYTQAKEKLNTLKELKFRIVKTKVQSISEVEKSIKKYYKNLHIQELVYEYNDLNSSVKEYKEDISNMEKELKTINICPYCGSKL